MTTKALTDEALRRTVLRFRDVLRDHQHELNELNVFPVPDGDTGTNLVLTMDAVAGRLEDVRGMNEVCEAISRGALEGGRGNSGVILSQFLRGMTSHLSTTTRATGPDLAEAIRSGSEAAYRAVATPLEGTILSVARAAAQAADAIESEGVVEVLDAAFVGAQEELARTPEVLDALANAGVVDAGGKGLLLLFAAMLGELDGREVAPPDAVQRIVRQGDSTATDNILEVMLLLKADGDEAAALRSEWSKIGDSVIVAGGGGLFNCHIHTRSAGLAIEAATARGMARDYRITDLLHVSDEGDDVVRSGEPATSLVVVVRGEGMRTLFEELGADVVMDPAKISSADRFAAIRGVEAASVLVVSVGTEDRDKLDETSVVLHARFEPQAVAAALVFDPALSATDNATIMEAEASKVRAASITETSGRYEAAGLVSTGDDLIEVASALLDRLKGDEAELITLIYGSGFVAEAKPAFLERVHTLFPSVTIEEYNGGGPDLLVIGVE